MDKWEENIIQLVIIKDLMQRPQMEIILIGVSRTLEI